MILRDDANSRSKHSSPSKTIKPPTSQRYLPPTSPLHNPRVIEPRTLLFCENSFSEKITNVAVSVVTSGVAVATNEHDPWRCDQDFWISFYHQHVFTARIRGQVSHWCPSPTVGGRGPSSLICQNHQEQFHCCSAKPHCSPLFEDKLHHLEIIDL